MDDILILLIPGLWIAGGIWSSCMALQLLSVSSEDRGVVKVTADNDPGLILVANKMVRLAYNRLGISIFAVMAGIILIFDELSETAKAAPTDDGLSISGLILIVGFLGMVLTQGVITILDLRDREKMTSVPG